MALSKEFYLDEIRSKYPNSYNESLKDLPVKDLEDMLDFLDQALEKADGGSIGIEVFFKEKMKDGGRVPMVSGGALKGLMSLFKGGDKAADLAKQEEIFRKGPITKEFLETVDSKVINPFVRTRDMKGPGSYGLYDNFDDMPAGLKAAEIIKRFVNRKTGEINYDAAEFFIGRKLKGDETIDELIDIAIKEPIGTGKGPFKDFEEYVLNPAKKADGGRVGLFMGGPALEGQALQIYNSMKGYNFSDQEIADALSARGLYTAPGSGTTTQPEQVTGIINQQINQSGDDKPMIQPFRQDPRVGSAFEAYQRNQALSAMGINDPFANEATLAGAYYDDMPNVDLGPGKQTFMGKVKSKLGSVVNLSPTLNFVKGIGEGIANILPVNQRAIAENIGGNMGIAVDDIGRIVNTGNYADPDNIMAGYSLNQLTDKSFDKRIDRTSKTLSEKYGLSPAQISGILEGTLSEKELADINARAIMPGTKKTTNLIKQLRSLNIAKDRNRFIQDVAKKEAERQEKERQAARDARALARAQEEINRMGYQDYGSGGASAAEMASYEAPDGSYAGASIEDYGGGEKDGGLIGYNKGGLATMFTRRR